VSEKRRGPTKVGDALAEMLAGSALGARIARAEVLAYWDGAVGPQIAAVTHARAIAENGTLMVSVKTSGWLQELGMMERSLIAKVNKRAGQEIVRRIRWELQR
jgi:predicted nucleic acid-binding Zn ribbon protein